MQHVPDTEEKKHGYEERNELHPYIKAIIL